MHQDMGMTYATMTEFHVLQQKREFDAACTLYRGQLAI